MRKVRNMKRWTPLLAMMVFILPAVCRIATADTIRDDLDAARKKHDQAVATAKQTLSKAIVSKIKDAAQKEDLASIKDLMAEKEAFDTDETLPTNPLLTEDVVRYIGARRPSSSATFFAYQSAIQAYVAKSQLDAAKKLELESKQFTEDELSSISLSKVTKASTDARKDTKPADS